MKRITIASTFAVLSVISIVILILTAKNCDVCFSPETLMIKLMLAGLVFIIGGIYFTWKYLKIERTIFNIETLPLLDTNEAVSNVPFSGEGIVSPIRNTLLTSPFTQTSCVYYHSILEKYVQRGKRKTWVIEKNLMECIPFNLTDDRGSLRIDVSGIDHDLSSYNLPHERKARVSLSPFSEIDAEVVLKHAEGSESKTLLGFIPSSTRIRQSEYILRPQTKIFAYGYVSQREGELLLHEYINHPLLISRKTKEEFIKDFYKGGNLIYAVHTFVSFGFTVFVLAANYFAALSSVVLTSIIALGNTAIIGSIIFTVYNRMITFKQRALATVSNIDVELKRRNELIPSIIAIVSQYTSYETDLFQNVVNARIQMISDTQTDTTGISAKPILIGLVEKYPVLASHKQYHELMLELIDTEERIAYSRSLYNKNAAKFNTVISQFPQNIFAHFLSLKPMDFITINEQTPSIIK